MWWFTEISSSPLHSWPSLQEMAAMLKVQHSRELAREEQDSDSEDTADTKGNVVLPEDRL